MNYSEARAEAERRWGRGAWISEDDYPMASSGKIRFVQDKSDRVFHGHTWEEAFAACDRRSEEVFPECKHCGHPGLSHDEEFGNCGHDGITETGWDVCDCPGYEPKEDE